MSNTPIILINAPKRAGKDYTAQVLSENFYTLPLKFATPMYQAIPGLFQITLEHWAYLYENHKETPSDLLMGMSPRQAMIWVSEEVMKPKFGEDVFGRIAVESIRNGLNEKHQMVTFSDSGFSAEALKVVEAFGAENVYLIRIYADGCDFVGDSRGLITPKQIKIPENHYLELYNDKTFNYDVHLLEAIQKLFVL